MHFLLGINTKQFWNIPKEKYFAPLRIPNLFIKSFANAVVDVELTFFDRSFNSILFYVTSFSLLSISVCFAKLGISLLLSKFPCLSLAAKFPDVNLLNSRVVMYLSWSLQKIFF